MCSPRPGTSSAAWCSATARCSTPSKACENTRRNSSRFGVRDISRRRMAWPWPAHCWMSLLSFPGASPKSSKSDRSRLAPLAELRFDLLRDLAHLRQKLFERRAQAYRRRRIANGDRGQDSILRANRYGKTGLLRHAPCAMRHAEALRASLVEQPLDFDAAARRTIL